MGSKEVIEEALKRDNVSTMFLVRPLGIVDKKENLFDSRIKKLGFIQAFIGDVNNTYDYTCPVFLLFKAENPEMQEFIDEEYEKKASDKRGILVNDYDYPGYVVLVYEFPEKYRADYNKIVWGKYSKVSEAFKFIFPSESTIDKIKIPSLLHQIFNKSPKLRENLANEYGLYHDLENDSEVYSRMNEDNSSDKLPKEMLDIKNYSK